MQDKITVAFGGRIFSDVKFPEEAFELIFLIDVVIVFDEMCYTFLKESARIKENLNISLRFS